jgi:putative tRNA adenosine deaminase-associated protein
MLLGDLAPPVTTVEVDAEGVGPDEVGPEEVPEPEPDLEPERKAMLPEAEPAGDADLLADLGVPARQLLALCAQEGMLPADITAEICQALGCGDEVEELREA